MSTRNVIEQIIKTLLKTRVKNHDNLWRLVSKISRQNRMPAPPTSKLLTTYQKLVKNKKIKPNPILEKLLCKRPVRTLSGVAIITVLTKPFKCPGRCIYCPNESGMPKSYLSNEPAAARAKLNNFDPYKQVRVRLEALESNGHPTDKVELIIKGGSWNAYTKNYREWFIKECFRASNDKISNSKFLISNKISKFKNQKSKILSREQKKNETAKHRIIGLTIETRPDMINEEEILHLRKIGCTRVELGVQTIYDDILKKCHREHGVKEIIEATKMLKDAGFKVDYHLMPGLPASTPQKDIKMFKKIFSNPDFVPDQIKIYPCAVIADTELYNLWKKGGYKPLGGEQLIKMLVKVKSEIIPRFCRIARLIRDIPSQSIVAGNKITNLREYIKKEMRQKNLKCKCLRCREIGHQQKISNYKFLISNKILTPRVITRRVTNSKFPITPASSPCFAEGKIGGVRGGQIPKLFIDKYPASGGMEYFLSFEDKKREIVYAFLRLRLPHPICHCRPPLCHCPIKSGNPENFNWILHPSVARALAGRQVRNDKFVIGSKHFIPELQNAALIRELHTYGHLIPLNYPRNPRGNAHPRNPKEAQHIGLGKYLMGVAEKITSDNNYKKIAVISGIGVREYYRKLGYKLKGTYMTKELKELRFDKKSPPVIT